MKNAKLVLALVVVLVMCMALSACQDPITYTLDKTTLSLEEGKTQQLKVIASDGSQATVTYTSSDAKVATVSNSGLVTAVAPGSATITAKVGETELKCAVTVTAKPVEYTYAISKSSVELEVGESETLSVTVTPNQSISVTWTSSAPAVATVTNGVVEAVAPGTATITASVDGKTLTCDVTVVKAPPLFTLAPSGTQDLEAGKTLQLTVTSSDEDPFEVVWSSSNNEIATVDQNGLVTAVAKGEAIIKATIGEVEKTCTIKVFQYSQEERRRNENYVRVKAMAERLGPMSEFGRNIVTRNPEPVKRGKIFEYDQERADLILAMAEIQNRAERALPPPKTAFQNIVSHEPYPVESKARDIIRQLKEHGITRFRLLFRGNRSRSEIVATFLAVLELCRARVLHLAGSETDCTVRQEGDLPENLTF